MRLRADRAVDVLILSAQVIAGAAAIVAARHPQHPAAFGSFVVATALTLAAPLGLILRSEGLRRREGAAVTSIVLAAGALVAFRYARFGVLLGTDTAYELETANALLSREGLSLGDASAGPMFSYPGTALVAAALKYATGLPLNEGAFPLLILLSATAIPLLAHAVLRSTFDLRVALLGAWVAAVAVPNVGHAFFMTRENLAILLVFTLVLGIVRAAEDTEATPWWIVTVIAAAAAAVTHYTTSYVVIVLAVGLLVVKQFGRQRVRDGLAHVPAVGMAIVSLAWHTLAPNGSLSYHVAILQNLPPGLFDFLGWDPSSPPGPDIGPDTGTGPDPGSDPGQEPSSDESGNRLDSESQNDMPYLLSLAFGMVSKLAYALVPAGVPFLYLAYRNQRARPTGLLLPALGFAAFCGGVFLLMGGQQFIPLLPMRALRFAFLFGGVLAALAALAVAGTLIHHPQARAAAVGVIVFFALGIPTAHWVGATLLFHEEVPDRASPDSSGAITAGDRNVLGSVSSMRAPLTPIAAEYLSRHAVVGFYDLTFDDTLTIEAHVLAEPRGAGGARLTVLPGSFATDGRFVDFVPNGAAYVATLPDEAAAAYVAERDLVLDSGRWITTYEHPDSGGA